VLYRNISDNEMLAMTTGHQQLKRHGVFRLDARTVAVISICKVASKFSSVLRKVLGLGLSACRLAVSTGPFWRLSANWSPEKWRIFDVDNNLQ